MQFLGSKRTISEKALIPLTPHQYRPNYSNRNAIRRTNWRNLLPVRYLDGDCKSNSSIGNNLKVQQKAITFRQTRNAVSSDCLEPLGRSSSCSSSSSSACRLRDVQVLLCARRSFSTGLCGDPALTWIPARRARIPHSLQDQSRFGGSKLGQASNFLQEELRGPSEARLRASKLGQASNLLQEEPFKVLESGWRGSKLGRKDHWNEEKRCPAYYSVTPNGDLEGTQQESEVRYDAILVLAGGQVAGGGVPVWVGRRLDKALDLQQRSSKNGAVSKIVCLGGGTPHRPPILSAEGFVIHESTSCAEYLHSKGAQFANVIKEWASYDTIGNGYFSLVQHVIPRRWRKLAVVTSEFHMPRTRLVFEWIFGLEGVGLTLWRSGAEVEDEEEDGVVAFTRSKAQGFQLEFHSVPDLGDLAEDIVQARLERERRSIENLKRLGQQIRSLEDFHEWFHTEHKAYNTEDQNSFGKEDISDPALQSY